MFTACRQKVFDTILAQISDTRYIRARNEFKFFIRVDEGTPDFSAHIVTVNEKTDTIESAAIDFCRSLAIIKNIDFAKCRSGVVRNIAMQYNVFMDYFNRQDALKAAGGETEEVAAAP